MLKSITAIVVAIAAAVLVWTAIFTASDDAAKQFAAKKCRRAAVEGWICPAK